MVARLGKAMALSDEGRHDEAVAGAEGAARAMPAAPGGWAVLAEIARRAGREETASDAIRRFHAATGRLPGDGDLPEWWGD